MYIPLAVLQTDWSKWMRLSKSDVICGIAATAARDLMREVRLDAATPGDFARILNVDQSVAAEIFARFVSEGYLEVSKSSQDVWRTSILGNALAQASLTKPITRRTAERHRDEVLNRVRHYNSDPEKLLAVSELRIFGSFLDPGVDRLGDVDLAVMLLRRYPGDEFVRRSIDYSNASGRRFGNYTQFLCWPVTEVYRMIKNGSGAISVTDEDISRFTDRHETIYAIADDPEAIQPPQGAQVQPLH